MAFDVPIAQVEVVSEVIKAEQPECFRRLREAFQCMENLAYHGGQCLGYTNESQINSALG